MKRRDFFKNIASITGAVLVAPILLSSLKSHAEGSRRGKRADAGGGPEMVDPNEPAAKAVHYVVVSKVKAKDCANCVLYVKTDTKNGKEVGTCAIFPKKLVTSKSYCDSWAKKS